MVEATNYLEQKIFVSLSAFIFASVARIYKLVVDLSTNMREAYTLLKDHFKVTTHINILNNFMLFHAAIVYSLIYPLICDACFVQADARIKLLLPIPVPA